MFPRRHAGSRWAWLLAAVAVLSLTGCRISRHTVSPSAAGSTAVTIDTADGLRLDGRLFAGNTTRLVILLHEYDGDQRDWYGFARSVVQSELASALTFDFRGYGASQGRRSTGEGLVTDVLGAVDWAHAHNYRSVTLVGASMGAAAGIIAASEDQSIGGVVALSPVAHFGGLNVVQAIHDHQPPLVMMAAEQDVSAVDSMNQIQAVAHLPAADIRTYPGDAHGAAMLTASNGAMVEQHLMTVLKTMWAASH